MDLTSGRSALVLAAILGASAGVAEAQVVPGQAGTRGVSPLGTTPGLYANPYANPYLNPFLNPYMTQAPTSAGSAALYFFAAQQATGGVGSGRLSGVRPDPSASAPAKPASARRASDTPGAGAAGYFNRAPRGGGRVERYYNRQGRYYAH